MIRKAHYLEMIFIFTITFAQYVLFKHKVWSYSRSQSLVFRVTGKGPESGSPCSPTSSQISMVSSLTNSSGPCQHSLTGSRRTDERCDLTIGNCVLLLCIKKLFLCLEFACVICDLFCRHTIECVWLFEMENNVLEAFVCAIREHKLYLY